MKPMFVILSKLFGRARLESLIKMEKVVFEPLGNILGNTYDNAMIIIDESQNTTPNQMMALLTRTGERSKVVVCGDYRKQKFIAGRDGLEDAVKRFNDTPGVSRVDFGIEDIVRSGFCRLAVIAYET